MRRGIIAPLSVRSTGRKGSVNRISTLPLVAVLVLVLCTSDGVAPLGDAVGAVVPPETPIAHVVIVYQENHSFDNVFGKLCVQDARCNGATSGVLPDGSSIALSQATDLIPPAAHYGHDQITA